MNILIKNGQIVKTGNQGSGSFKADILIKKNSIAKVGKVGKEDLRGLKLGKTIDAKGKFVIPGFIQTHVHLCQTLFRGMAEDLPLLDWLKEKIWPFEASHTKESIRKSATIGIKELLTGGTTTIVDMATANHTEEIFETAGRLGIRAFIGNALMDSGEGLPKEFTGKLSGIIDKSFKLIDKYHGSFNGRLNYILAPRFILSCSDDLFREVKRISDDKNLMIETHAAENKTENEIVIKIKGKNEIHYFEDAGILNEKLILAHCIWLTDDDFELLQKRNVSVAHCPTVNLKLGSGIAKVPEMLKHGLTVTLGSDGAPCNNSLNMFNEMKLSGLLQKFRLGPTVLPSKQIFDMATISGAKAIHMENKLGSIEEGKLADLVILDLNKPNTLPEIDDIYTRIVYSASSSNVETVLVDGKIVF